jgi:hypothetical protein
MKRNRKKGEKFNIRRSERYTVLKKRNGRALLLCHWDVTVKYMLYV